MRCLVHVVIHPGCLTCEVVKLEAIVDVLTAHAERNNGKASLDHTIACLQNQVEMLIMTATAATNSHSTLTARVNALEARSKVTEAMTAVVTTASDKEVRRRWFPVVRPCEKCGRPVTWPATEPVHPKFCDECAKGDA